MGGIGIEREGWRDSRKVEVSIRQWQNKDQNQNYKNLGLNHSEQLQVSFLFFPSLFFLSRSAYNLVQPKGVHTLPT